MTVPPVSEAPPAAPAPANRRGLMIGIGIAVVLCLCLCIGGALLFQPLSGPFTAAAGLPQECVDRTGLDAQTCGEWVQGVGSPTISECINEQMSAGTTVTAGTLYDCLVDKAGAP